MSAVFSEHDHDMMRRVLQLATQGENTTQPNPRVGCVLVKEGVIVGEGFHRSAGDLHAEREALKQAGESARGATAYVNLEPCCHQGRTPPCTDGLINAGVVKVIAAMLDPNPLVAGGGFEQLKLAGIEVVSGLLEDEAKWLNRGFVTRMRQKRPWIRLKSAATLDGRTADANGVSQWITCDTARNSVQELRASSAAVMTGIGTVLADDPSLNVRLDGAQRQPARIVLDTQLRFPSEAKMIDGVGDILVFTCSQDHAKVAALIEQGVEVIQQDSEILELENVLSELGEWQFNEVLVEAGESLSGSMLGLGLIDELVMFYGGSALGDTARGVFKSSSAIEFKQRPEFSIREVRQVGESARIDSVNPASLEALLA